MIMSATAILTNQPATETTDRRRYVRLLTRHTCRHIKYPKEDPTSEDGLNLKSSPLSSLSRDISPSPGKRHKSPNFGTLPSQNTPGLRMILRVHLLLFPSAVAPLSRVSMDCKKSLVAFETESSNG
jgi:hypothetical protein